METVFYRKRLTMQGFGLSFLLSAILFVLTGQYAVFAVVPLGLLLGFALGSWLDQRKPAAQAVSVRAAGKPNALSQALFHPRLLVRFASLLVLGAALLIAAWYAGYYLLPSGALLGPRAAERAAAAQPGLALLLAEIVGRNAAWVLVIALINLLLLPSGFGYLIPLTWCLYYGLLLGTNSFGVPMPERLAPSLLIFQRAGPLEMAAYLLAAAASFQHAAVPGLWQRLRKLSPAAWAALALSLLLILLAAAREALMILARTG
jgi:hypothetical protein